MLLFICRLGNEAEPSDQKQPTTVAPTTGTPTKSTEPPTGTPTQTPTPTPTPTSKPTSKPSNAKCTTEGFMADPDDCR